MTDKDPKPTHIEKEQNLRRQLTKAVEEDSKPLVDVKAAILEKIRIQEELIADARAKNPNDRFTIGCLEARRLSLLGALKYQPVSQRKTDDPEVLENPTAEEKLLLEVPCNLPEHLTLRRSAGCANLLAACDSTTPPSVKTGKPSVTGPVTPPSEEDDFDVQLLDPATSTQSSAPRKVSEKPESEPTESPVTQEKDEHQDPDSQPKTTSPADSPTNLS
ncbi:hypothetical protein QAD02_021894 [Eretmocerus hayati]|uniref:Uncharacterized protein n=2 Tax=Eretmocerus hayati TaxID=131215 RepID=A0ACC2PWB5_9HYME|nr:hypothetical protein QAD02_007371 [Eretmocerus hayati]KAJ8686100.1 hypothetical protein QAD02_021894 [Eretmocerus hayati]